MLRALTGAWFDPMRLAPRRFGTVLLIGVADLCDIGARCLYRYLRQLRGRGTAVLLLYESAADIDPRVFEQLDEVYEARELRRLITAKMEAPCFGPST